MGQLIYNKGSQTYTLKKSQSLQQSVAKAEQLYAKKITLNYYFTSYSKINSKQIEVLKPLNS